MTAATLDLVLERRIEDIHEPDFTAYVPLISFEAFLPAQRIFGWIRLDADRLTDLLNEHDLIRLSNVHVEEHRDGTTVAADETVIPRAEIVAVIASGPRGEAALRVPTTPHPVSIDTQTYEIGGNLQVPTFVGAMERWHAGGPMIPLTEAWISYRSGGEQRRAAWTTVIVNRDTVTEFELFTAPEPHVLGLLG